MFYPQIYSVFNGVVYAYIKFDGDQTTVNQILIERGLAEYCEENYMSKVNSLTRFFIYITLNDLILLFNQADSSQRKYHQEIEQDRLNYFNRNIISYLHNEAAADVEPPPANLCKKVIKLNGPYSPLEIKVSTLSEGGKTKHVDIDRHSVNHILLENDPQVKKSTLVKLIIFQ